jgi:tetratricopeptide (TPR) repeat protein
MCHYDVERGSLHRFIEQETTRINPFTDQPFGRIDAICTSCHNALHLAHPVGIIPDPQKVTLPPEAIGFKGEEDRLTCMSCHDWHPTNTSYKYLRWAVADEEELSRFCLNCHTEQGIRGDELASAGQIRQDFKLINKSDSYLKDPQIEKSHYYKGYRGARFNLTVYDQRQKAKAQPAEAGQQSFPLTRLAEAETDKEKYQLVNQLGESISLESVAAEAEDLPDDFKHNYKQGLTYKQRGDINNAIIYFKKAIELRPDFPATYCELGQAYLTNEWVEEAQAMFQKAISIAPDFAPAYVGLGNLYKAKGDYAPAAKVYKTALKLDPNHGQAYYQLGLLYKQAGKLDDARQMFSKAVNTSGTQHPAAYYELGLIYKESSPSQAEEMFNRAVLNTDHAGAYYELGLIHKQQGKLTSAKEMFSEAIAAESSDPRVYYELASIYKLQGFIDQAMSAYTRVTKLDKNFYPAYYQLGLIFLENRQLSDAAKMLSQSIKLRPHYYEAHYRLAEVYYKQKKIHKAIKCYKRVIEIKNDYAEAYFGLGKCYRQLDKLNKAIRNLKRALALQPAYAEAHYILGTIFKAKGRDTDAEQQFQLAMNLSRPADHKSAGLSSSLNDKIAFYKIATSLDSEDPEAFYNLGVAYMTRGQLKEAVTAYRQAINLKPDYVEALHNIALAYKAQNQWPQAVAALQRVIQLTPNFIDARHTLAETLQAQGQWEQALEQYQRILPHKPAIITHRIARIYLDQWSANRQQNMLEQANEYVRRAVELNPQNVAARRDLEQTENLLAGKIHTLLITTADYKKINKISQLIKNNLSLAELEQVAKLYPQETQIMFVLPDELNTPIREKLIELENGAATDIIRDGKQYYIIYRIDSRLP